MLLTNQPWAVPARHPLSAEGLQTTCTSLVPSSPVPGKVPQTQQHLTGGLETEISVSFPASNNFFNSETTCNIAISSSKDVMNGTSREHGQTMFIQRLEIPVTIKGCYETLIVTANAPQPVESSLETKLTQPKWALPTLKLSSCSIFLITSSKF